MAALTTIERETVITARAADITPYLADLHRWVEWSPWEGQDPALQRTYTGEPGTVGSTYAWKGNRKAGAGSMAITRADATEVDVDLQFTAPFKSSSAVAFRLHEATDGTLVVWSMTSPQNLMSRVMGVFVNMDKFLGGDFEKGLTKLKAAVER
ncbi:polyketide cyclase/dehydrase/lipid transport protein [Curtobacterium sp. PhB42]|uniref:SRPBCC family protein n=1 Tax=unclassified Curtobacterium TaxID=257496 RepID=UPI0010630D52|nr:MULTISPECIES: SRPBCC family protein [unclassified Curtobacterium]TDW51227.1 polyketide cyclase/dehydrase/lipid transport protein [Curtobacterium sp. PhB42]TDW55927.1 polyketide cyclase/dehydrase/lipid transport protein [Curtobacterium sp. PhB190]